MNSPKKSRNGKTSAVNNGGKPVRVSVPQNKKEGALPRVLLVLTLLVFTLAILFTGFYSASIRITEASGIYQGVSINGVDVGGMTLPQAEALLQSRFEEMAAQTVIIVSCGSVKESFSMLDAGAKLVLDEAFEALEANQGSTLLQKMDTRLQFENQQGFSVDGYITYDKDMLMEKVSSFAEDLSYDPVDATVEFGRDASFYFKEGAKGRALDADALCNDLFARFKGENYEPVTVQMYVVEPEITKAMLEKHTVMLGTCSTTATGSLERLTNIFLITDAVNGQMIRAGEELSLNSLTGERTPDKGYMEAPAIRNGELIEEIGGGICQLSGTLYNAALLSGLEITERHHHTWPSDYLPIGLDATITWPGKDLKIRNNTDWPIYIHATVEGDQLTVTFYGENIYPGITIKVENDVFETTDAPEPTYEEDATRPVGYRRTLTKERLGYRVRVIRYFYDGDELINSEIVSTDRFYPIAGKYVIGTMVEEPSVSTDNDK